jgi:hypothetical protein
MPVVVMRRLWLGARSGSTGRASAMEKHRHGAHA